MAWNQPGRSAPKVGICVPSKGTVSDEWAITFAMICKATSVEFDIYQARHFEIDYARNDLVDQARKGGCTHVLFLDNDVYPFILTQKPDDESPRRLIPFPGIIEYMLFHQYPIVAGMYWLKRNLWNVAVASGDEFRPNFLAGPYADFADRHFYVDIAAGGLVMVDIRVFDHTPYPWFNYFRAKKRSEDGTWPEIAEDFWFCYRAKERGFPILVLGEVLAKHDFRGFATWGGNADMILTASNIPMT